MFGIVMDVSAMFVATITLRVSLAALQNTFSCSEFGREPYIARGKSFTKKQQYEDTDKILNFEQIYKRPMTTRVILYPTYVCLPL